MVGSEEAVSAQGRTGCRSPRSSSASSTFCAPCSDPPSPTSTRRSGAAGSRAPTHPPKSPQRWMASSRGCWRARATERCRAGLLPTRLAVCVCLPCASHGLARHPARKDVFTQPECRCLQVSAAEVEATVAGSGMPEAWTQAMASRAEATAAAFAAKDGKKCASHLSDRLGITAACSHSRTRAFDESKRGGASVQAEREGLGEGDAARAPGELRRDLRQAHHRRGRSRRLRAQLPLRELRVTAARKDRNLEAAQGTSGSWLGPADATAQPRQNAPVWWWLQKRAGHARPIYPSKPC